MKNNREISIPTLIVENFRTEEVVAFLTDKFKKYNNRYGAPDPELEIWIQVLDALNRKLNGGSKSNVI